MGRLVALIVSMLFAVVAGLFVFTQVGSLGHRSPAEAAPSNEIAVDANPSTPGIDSSVSVPPGSTFSLGINVTQVAQPYNDVQFELSWPAAALKFTGGRAQEPSSPFNCQIQPNDVMSGGQEMVQDSCGSGAMSQTYTGRIETLDVRCMSVGTFLVHLVTQVEDPNFGSYLLDAGANALPTNTVDATVTCTDATATPTPSSTPCPGSCPTATKTVVPTATSTATPTLTPCSSNCGLAIDADPSTSAIDTMRTVSLSSLFLVGIDNNLAGVSYQGYQVEVSWSDADLDFGGSTFRSSSSPMKICQSPIDHHGPPAGTEILQDSCEDGSGPHMYVGQVETVELVCRTTGTFTLHLVTYAQDSFFGSALIDHNAHPIPTGTTDATITCSDATATPIVTNTATATATPTHTAAPVRVGGVADVHIVTDNRLADDTTRNESSRIRRATWMSVVMASALSIAAGAWYLGNRRQL